MSIKVLAMGGDGIGPEVVDAALQVLEVAARSIKLSVDLSEDLLHGACWERHGTFLRPETLEKARVSDALLVGATGARQWDHIVIDGGPDEQDLHELLQAVKTMREVMARPQIAKYVTGELGAWKGAKSDAEIIEAIRATAYTGHYPCSTARMGADPGAVLDEQLRVTGIDNLRVCDAAAMPTQITGNPNATVIAMTEKAADMILEREPLPAEDPRSPS